MFPGAVSGQEFESADDEDNNDDDDDDDDRERDAVRREEKLWEQRDYVQKNVKS